jgi:glycosyltransferase involved in cell wall biosynthesis
MIDTRSLVSVVMPSLNQARFVEAAVRSVLEQDYQALELVVVDGGSSDGTLQRLEALLGEFGARLRWISEKDSGPANAVNKALRLARGNIIGWLNSDDLYAPGAISKAVECFMAKPDMLMAYGEGEHVDSQGKSLGRYPTKPPSTPIQAFQDGCFICQPTVFLRREVFEALGYLDESLATAFDFELWVRIFKRFPDRIAFIEFVLAYSRLHPDSITSRQRRLVATEGINILGKYLGKAKPHWLLTYVEELYRYYPHVDEIQDLRAHVQSVLEDIRACLDERDIGWVKDTLARDARFRLALPDVFAAIYSDGWAPPDLVVRARGARNRIVLRCEHVRPDRRPIRLEIIGSWGGGFLVMVNQPGPFNIEVCIPADFANSNVSIVIRSDGFFVPGKMAAGSSDFRQLVFRILGIC